MKLCDDPTCVPVAHYRIDHMEPGFYTVSTPIPPVVDTVGGWVGRLAERDPGESEASTPSEAQESRVMVRPHPSEKELRRARDAAQALAERLEMAGLDILARAARDIREAIAERLAR